MSNTYSGNIALRAVALPRNRAKTAKPKGVQKRNIWRRFLNWLQGLFEEQEIQASSNYYPNSSSPFTSSHAAFLGAAGAGTVAVLALGAAPWLGLVAAGAVGASAVAMKLTDPRSEYGQRSLVLGAATHVAASSLPASLKKAAIPTLGATSTLIGATQRFRQKIEPQIQDWWKSHVQDKRTIIISAFAAAAALTTMTEAPTMANTLPNKAGPMMAVAQSPVERAVNMIQLKELNPSQLDVMGIPSDITSAPLEFQSSAHFVSPFAEGVKLRVSDGFGWRVDPFGHGHRHDRPCGIHARTGHLRWCELHTGVDLAVPRYTPVAGDGGRVLFAGRFSGYGNLVEVSTTTNDGKIVDVLYGHLQTIEVKAGQDIEPGQMIGRVGSTGLATGPHLHYEIRQTKMEIGQPCNDHIGRPDMSGRPVNPLSFSEVRVAFADAGFGGPRLS